MVRDAEQPIVTIAMGGREPMSSRQAPWITCDNSAAKSCAVADAVKRISANGPAHLPIVKIPVAAVNGLGELARHNPVVGDPVGSQVPF